MKIGIIGCTGKLAHEIIDLLSKQNIHRLTAAIARKENSLVGKTIQCNQDVVEISSDMGKCELCDVLIDVTRRDSFVEQNLKFYQKLQKPLIIATTGFTEEDEKKIQELSNEIAICKSSNFSEELLHFVNALKNFAKNTSISQAAIIESHHKTKKDIPSGTALLLKDAICSVNNKIDVSIYSIRAGVIKGEHEVLFANEFGEEIKFIHKATSRAVFAGGIIKASEKLLNKKSGLYSFEEILNIEK